MGLLTPRLGYQKIKCTNVSVLLSENLKIKLTHLLKQIGLLEENHNLIFMKKSTFEDYVSILKRLNVLDVAGRTLDRIYSWGNRSLHSGQSVPIHIIWISIYY